MALSENQLDTWSNQGATATSASTYNSIKTCIEGHNWNNDVYYNIYLQGSYKNTTNIRGDSDVDVFVEFTSVFYSNSHELSVEQFREFDEFYDNGKYSLDSFKAAIIQRLKYYFNDDYVKVGNKSIKVLANSGRLDCDVVCCAEYREYNSFDRYNTGNYAKGIVFWTTNTNEKVVNFPNIHYDNGTNKNQNCNSNYKPSVRIVKNMKSRLINLGRISSSLAPSYFIECLMYNVPNSDFQNTTHYSRILAVLNTFYNYSDADLNALVCQNRQRYLFGESDQQWNSTDCKIFINKLIELWNEG